MTKEKAIAIAAAYFPTYPKVGVFHVTHDGQVFEEAAAADSHARHAFKEDDERVVVPVTREEFEASDPEAAAEMSDAEKEKAAAITKAQDNVKALGKTVKAKQKALDKASDDQKENLQKELEAADTELKTAEVDLQKLLEAE